MLEEEIEESARNRPDNDDFQTLEQARQYSRCERARWDDDQTPGIGHIEAIWL